MHPYLKKKVSKSQLYKLNEINAFIYKFILDVDISIELNFSPFFETKEKKIESTFGAYYFIFLLFLSLMLQCRSEDCPHKKKILRMRVTLI